VSTLAHLHRDVLVYFAGAQEVVLHHCAVKNRGSIRQGCNLVRLEAARERVYLVPEQPEFRGEVKKHLAVDHGSTESFVALDLNAKRRAKDYS
jgi:hypothetical protein